MLYHHLYDNPRFSGFNIEGKTFSFFLHYARKGAFQFTYPVIGSQLIPEDHFQAYFITQHPQQFEFKLSGKYSLLSFAFSSVCLNTLRSYSPMVNRFIDKATRGNVAALFQHPQLITPENKRIINSVFLESWSDEHLEHMVKLVLLPALRSPEYQPFIMTNVSNDPIYAIAEWIIMHLDEPVSIPFLSQKFLLNEFKLKYDFKKTFGVPVITFQRKARIERAKQLLLRADLTIANVARMVGFIHTGYFSDFFKRETGSSPSDFRRKSSSSEIVVSNDRA